MHAAVPDFSVRWATPAYKNYLKKSSSLCIAIFLILMTLYLTKKISLTLTIILFSTHIVCPPDRENLSGNCSSKVELRCFRWCCRILKNSKTNGITNWSKLCERFNSHKPEIITQLEWIHILYFNLECINSSDGFQTLAISGSKPRIFNSNLLLVSQKLFSNDYKKVCDIDIFGNFRNF